MRSKSGVEDSGSGVVSNTVQQVAKITNIRILIAGVPDRHIESETSPI
jgi:hypothetical protein